MSQEESSSTDKLIAAPSLTATLSKMLDGKFKDLTVLESDVDSYTISGLRLDDDRTVIIRLLKPTAAAQAVIVERFNSEVNRLQALVHHNVPRCLDSAVTASGQPYAVFVSFSGRSLRSILDDESNLKIERAVNITKQVCAALTAAHRLEIVEHNLSPRNIYLTTVQGESDVVKMPAVGFVETAPAVGETFLHATPNFSQNDSVVYKSPEGCLGRNLDERSTVYSIACFLFELLTGTVPVLGRTALQTGNRHLKEKPMLLEEVRPDLRFPRELQDIISKALEKDSDDRYSTILQMQYALKKIEIIETPAVWTRPKRQVADIRNFKTILPGEITSWNLITSHRSGVDTPDAPRGILGQIGAMFALGFWVVLLLINPNALIWVTPLIMLTLLRLIWLARPSRTPTEIPPLGYGKIATLPKD